MNARGLAVVISGPSGAGKTTLCKRLVAEYGYDFSVSMTTRPPRPGETDGRDYRFVTREAFLDGVQRGELLEHSEHFGHLYGTPKGPVDEAVRSGRVILLDIDVVGGEQVLRRLPDALAVFVTAPDDRENERRLRGRGTDGEAAIRERLGRAGMEKTAQAGLYACRVVNDDRDEAVRRIHALIESEVEKRHGR